MTPTPPNGSATSSQLELFPLEWSTSEASPMSIPVTSEDTDPATSSPESADGLTPSTWPDGPETDLFGQALVPASPSAPQESKAAALTSGISGLNGFGSSPSVALTQSLANRLRERLGSDGSTEYSQTWKRLVTPAGRRYWAHTASARRTSDSDCSGWRSPMARDANPSEPQGHTSQLTHEAQLAGWATPDAYPRGGPQTPAQRAGHTINLQDTAQLAGWPTPQTHDVTTRGNTMADHHHFPHDLSNAAQLAGWQSPKAGDHSARKHHPEREDGGQPNLAWEAQMAGWATPASRDWKSDEGTDEFHASRAAHPRGKPLSEQTRGLTPSGSPASTEKRGALNPAFSLWLQGYPSPWMAAAPSAASVSSKARATASSRKSRRNSSAPC